MTDVTVGVDLLTTQPPIREVSLLSVDTSGNSVENHVVAWSRPDVLQITVPLISFLNVLSRQAEGVQVDLGYDPDDPPRRAAWLKQGGMAADPPENRPGL